jgi:hypothetical protein
MSTPGKPHRAHNPKHNFFEVRMAKSYQRTLLAGLLSLAPLFGACDSSSDLRSVTEPDVVPTVAYSPKQVKVVTRVTNGTTGIAISDYVTNGKTAHLKIGKYELDVPRGAVHKPTRFMMIVLENEMIGVKLYAFDKDWKPVTRFQRPLQLTLPYDEADHSEIASASKLYIANVVSEQDATILEMVATSVDKDNQTVTGGLYHFSVWSLAVQFSKELSPGID